MHPKLVPMRLAYVHDLRPAQVEAELDVGLGNGIAGLAREALPVHFVLFLSRGLRQGLLMLLTHFRLLKWRLIRRVALNRAVKIVKMLLSAHDRCVLVHFEVVRLHGTEAPFHGFDRQVIEFRRLLLLRCRLGDLYALFT